MSTERWASCPCLCHSASHVPRKPPETEPTAGKNCPSPMHDASPQQLQAKSFPYRSMHTCTLRWAKGGLLQPCWEMESKETSTNTEVVPHTHIYCGTPHTNP